MENTNKQNNYTLVAIIACVLLPIGISLFLYLTNADIARKNYGTLLTPHHHLNDWERQRPEDFVENKWSLLVLVDDCTNQQSCKDAVFFAHQIHQLLNKNYSRVQRFLVYNDETNLNILKETLANKVWQYWQVKKSALKKAEIITNASLPIFLLLDPRQNIVLYYQDFSQPKRILSDIKQLLKASQIG